MLGWGPCCQETYVRDDNTTKCIEWGPALHFSH